MLDNFAVHNNLSTWWGQASDDIGVDCCIDVNVICNHVAILRNVITGYATDLNLIRSMNVVRTNYMNLSNNHNLRQNHTKIMCHFRSCLNLYIWYSNNKNEFLIETVERINWGNYCCYSFKILPCHLIF